MTVFEPEASRMAALLTGVASKELEDDFEEPGASVEEAELEEVGFVEEEDEEIEEVGLEEEDRLGFAELELTFSFALSPSFSLPFSPAFSFPFSPALSFPFSPAFSFSFCFSFSFIACNLDAFSLCASLGLDEELELELASLPPDPVETAAEADGEAEVPAAGGSGWAFSSCETSWIEKKSISRKPRFLLTASHHQRLLSRMVFR